MRSTKCPLVLFFLYCFAKRTDNFFISGHQALCACFFLRRNETVLSTIVNKRICMIIVITNYDDDDEHTRKHLFNRTDA